jgi:hypothetical protein
MHKHYQLIEYTMNELSMEELGAKFAQRREENQKARAGHTARRKEIMKLHLVDNISMSDLGRRFGLSRQRIYQILNGTN